MTKPESRTRVRGKVVLTVMLLGLFAGGAVLYLRGPLFMQMMGHTGGMHMHGQDGEGHDEINMPGLKGENATPEESAELAIIFQNFKTLTRNVTNLPDGIRTVTRSSDPAVMAKLVSHVTGMIGRVQSAQDPKIIIQSKTLDIFFAQGKNIVSDIEVTEEGIIVVQTSKNPAIVTALQTHAAEVSDMAARGMQAVHERMMGEGQQ